MRAKAGHANAAQAAPASHTAGQPNADNRTGIAEGTSQKARKAPLLPIASAVPVRLWPACVASSVYATPCHADAAMPPATSYTNNADNAAADCTPCPAFPTSAVEIASSTNNPTVSAAHARR